MRPHPRRRFERLPPEIIQDIVAHVAIDSPRSLLNFLFTSKFCYACALPSAKALFYNTVVISLGSIKTLGLQVKRLTERLESANSCRDVRRLVIDGELNSGYSKHYEWRPASIPDFECSKCNLKPCSHLHGDLDGVYCGTSSWDRQQHWAYQRESRPTRPIDQEEVWTPVVDLIKRLPALEDLLYRSYQRFPAPLLRALQQERPKCRLHLQSFSLRRHYALKADPYENELVSSPSLYSVLLSCERKETAQNPEPEAALLSAVRLAPNLEKVYVERFSSAGNRSSLWKSHTKADSTRRLSLQKLRLYNRNSLAGMSFSGLMEFSNLETLDLRTCLESTAFDSWFMNCSFPSLQNLALVIKPPYRNKRQASGYYETTQRFLQNLPPLTELSLQGWHSLLAIAPIVRRYGPRLRKLDLSFLDYETLTEGDILQIGKHCPLLEDLKIALQRSQGDAQEVARYRALGTLRSLRYLHLTLDGSDVSLREEDSTVLDTRGTGASTPSQPSFDSAYDNEFSEVNIGSAYRSRNGHVRRLIVNSAVDKNLACAIFKAISSVSPEWSPLKEMTIKVRGRTDLESRHDHFKKLVRMFSPSWRVELDRVNRDQLVTTELRMDDTIWALWRMDDTVWKDRQKHLPLWLDDIFYRIWPRRKVNQKRKVTKKLMAKRLKEREETTSTWWHDWKSFPLAEDS